MKYLLILLCVLTGQAKDPYSPTNIHETQAQALVGKTTGSYANSYKLPPEIDVPAIQEMRKTKCIGGTIYPGGCTVALVDEPVWTCADKKRILMTAEDDSKHCLRFNFSENEPK